MNLKLSPFTLVLLASSCAYKPPEPCASLSCMSDERKREFISKCNLHPEEYGYPMTRDSYSNAISLGMHFTPRPSSHCGKVAILLGH